MATRENTDVPGRDGEGVGQPVAVLEPALPDVAHSEPTEALEGGCACQPAIAQLGIKALSGPDLPTLLQEAAALMARSLGVEYCSVLELLPDNSALLLRAGVGWNDDCVGRATVAADRESQASYTLLWSQPVIVDDLRTETRFCDPLLVDHGVVSGMSVAIQGEDRPFGVLGAHTTKRRAFTEDEVSFLQAIANVLALAIGRIRAEEVLRDSEHRLRGTLDGMLEGCQIIGFDWRYLYVNDAVARQGRHTKEELLGHTMMEMYPGIDETEMFGYLRRCMEQRIPHRMQTEFTYPDDANGWFELSIQPVPEGIFILSLDITERTRLEEALRRAREELEEKAERAVLTKNPYGLSFREFTVLHLVAAGKTDKKIASTLVISVLTASKHVANILAKMQAASRTEAGVRAVREGLID